MCTTIKFYPKPQKYGANNWIAYNQMLYITCILTDADFFDMTRYHIQRAGIPGTPHGEKRGHSQLSLGRVAAARQSRGPGRL